MKRTQAILIYLATLVSLTGCYNIHRMDSSKLSVVSAADAAAHPAKWEEAGQQIQAGKDVVIKVEAGQTLPLKLDLVLPMTKLVAGQNQLLFTRDTYFLVSHSKLRISPDGRRWADAYDFTAMKKLFGFEKGDLSIGFESSQQQGGVLSIGATARK